MAPGERITASGTCPVESAFGDMLAVVRGTCTQVTPVDELHHHLAVCLHSLGPVAVDKVARRHAFTCGDAVTRWFYSPVALVAVHYFVSVLHYCA